jgi:ATPase subunit of ABC transporter with duplicated ATPase domains
MIVGEDLTVEIGDRTLLRDGSFLVGQGEKVGLVGRNGTGKSTLLSVLVGHPSPAVRSRGKARVAGTMGFLPQQPVPGGEGLEPIGFSHVLSGRGLDVLDGALDEARTAMAADPTSTVIQHFSDLEEEFRSRGGYEAEAVMARLADGLGLRQELLLEDIDDLSGGQRRRVDLMRLLFQAPDLLILDEPTNHLDLAAKAWLMQELATFGGAVLVVSHDLKLLDRSIDKVLHLFEGTLREYRGTYSSFLVQREEERDRTEKAAALEDREITRLSTLADRMRGSTAKRARVAKSLDKRVTRLESSRTAVEARDRATTFRLPVPTRSGEIPLEVDGLAVAYGTNRVLDDITFHCRRGDRVVVVGRNGAGKSSLLRCLAGVQVPSGGTIGLGAHVTLGYFAQEHEQIDPHLTVLDHIDDTVLALESERRSLLGVFGLSGAVAHQRPRTLSGGERAKLALAMLAAGRANVLLLDEPTNNLDPASVDAVGRMLAGWPGTVVAVSHDRPFVEVLAPTHTLLLPEERFTHWRDEHLDQVELI